MKHFAVILTVAVVYLLGSQGVVFAQAEHHDADQKQATSMSAVYTCPMHPEVKSDKPGKCPKCGMSLVLKEAEKSNSDQAATPSEKIAKAKSLLAEVKKSLMKEAKYNCCIKDPCDRCALDHQSCPCAEEVKSGKSVCPDCYAGWQRGDGIVKGVKASSVKGSFHSHNHEH